MKNINTACIIDDDHIFVFGIKHMIEMSDFSNSLIFYSNGKEAIEGIKSTIANGEQMPDLILLDLNMPIMDGWQFLDEFEKIEQNSTKVFIISSSINPIDLEKSKQYSTVVDYVLKPISVEKIDDIFQMYSSL